MPAGMPIVRPWRCLWLWGHEGSSQGKLLQWDSTSERAITLATPNYGYEKRQRELAKKKKKEDKLRAKASGARHDTPDAPSDGGAENHSSPPATPGSEGSSSS